MSKYLRRNVQNLKSYQPGEQPKEGGFIKLNTNENAYPPSPAIAKLLSGLSLDSLRLYPDPVCSKLREALAHIHKCRPEQIFVGNGSDEVLALCVRAFVEQTGSVGFFEPSYSLYPVLAEIAGVIGSPVSLWPDFTWNMPADYGASLFFLANPNAPTSIQYPKEIVHAFCKKFPGVVLIDEAYADFARYNCIDLALSMENVLVGRTLSKAYSLAGLRVGYVVGSEALIEGFYKIKDSYNVDRLAQEVAAAAILDQAHMRANVEKIKATRTRIGDVLDRLDFEVCPSDTNFLWVKPPKMSAADLFKRLREKKILVRYFPAESTADYLRITMGTDEQMDQLIAVLTKMLE
ncbi:MAG TPA: histidinol-phosphate transaminase [Verrucomicrobia bacterium]|nr:MAG: histidinol-phosphate transaminase [Lentisphaerae bacterium GWF2_57_35]HBA83303.1 histidinol-phosphate transaminase [Verrucomicrobiota bacterium]